MDKNIILYKKTENESLENQKIEQAKKISVKEGSAYSFMDGFGMRYITPFALAIGANNFIIGLLSSFPSLFGNLSQLYTLKVMDKWKRKKIVYTAVFLQAIMWLFLIGVGSLYFVFNIHTKIPSYFLVIFYTLLILFGAFGGPAWTSWMKDLVAEDSGHYFGRRSRIAGIISIICMLIAGFILDYFKSTKLFMGFAIIFFIAFLGRIVSGFLILKQYEPDFKTEKESYFTIFQFIKKMRHNNFGRFTIYFSLVSLTTAIASPFFAVYMLKNLSFSYTQFMTVTIINSIFGLIFVVPWGKFADRFGNMKVMHIAGFLTPLIPFLYIGSALILGESSKTIFFWVIAIEAFSGFAWAGFNLSGSNFIYDAVTRQKMAICVSYFNIINGFGVLIGSFAGGIMASYDFSLFNLNTLLFIFLLSGISRFLAYFFFNYRIKEVRFVESFDRGIFLREVKDGVKKRMRENIDILRVSSGSLRKFFESNITSFGNIRARIDAD